MLKSAGLDPKIDVKWAYLGTPAAQYAALTSGQVDAGNNAWPFNVMARQAGFKVLGDGKEMHLAGASLTLGAQRQWVASNQKLVDNFLRALSESAHIANTDKAKAQAAMQKHALSTVNDQAFLDEAFDRFSGTFPEPPYITKEAVQEAITDEPNPAVKGHKPEDYIDNGPLDAVVASGFTQQFATGSASASASAR
jgi:ABC-type nitrate/sulfonate/bicarbonate transport system substrate-binding protein